VGDSEVNMNETTNQPLYQPGDFARRAGVTVRALHHYDRLGLLKPSSRTGAGYRLYGQEDFARLQQIVTLKFIGFSLREIKKLLAGMALPTALRLQRITLEQKRQQLDRAIAAISQAERLLKRGPGPDWEAFVKIIKEVQMQTHTEWVKKYYKKEAQQLLAEKRKLWSPELQKQTEDKWARLFSDIERAAKAEIDPASPRAQALAERHAKLIEALTGGHPSIGDGLARLWKDRANWPAEFQRRVFEPFAKRGITPAQNPNPRFLSQAGSAFLGAALRARFMNKYFSTTAQKLVAGGQRLWAPKLRKRWAALREDIERAARNKVDPHGSVAAGLAKKHARLMKDLTGDNPAVLEGLAKLWKDRANWPAEFLSETGGAFLKAALGSAKATNQKEPSA
jgi:DNA-binding transcriptional MerR regulator